MRIAVLGTGNVGATLGRRLAMSGHEVCFGTRNVADPRVQSLLTTTTATACEIHAATNEAELVILAVPWQAALSVLDGVRHQLSGKILVDCTNPLNANFSGLEFGHTTSAAEIIAAHVPEARVVKSFNTVSAATMANPQYGDRRATLFYCGDDENAKAAVHSLAEQLGFEPIDAGRLQNARLLEPLAMLYIHLAFNGWGSNCAIQVVKR